MDPYLDHSAASSEPLLGKSLSNWKEPSRFRKTWLVALAIHLSIILIYSSAFLWSWHYLKEQYVHGPRLTYSQYCTRQDKKSKLINAMQVPQEMPLSTRRKSSTTAKSFSIPRQNHIQELLDRSSMLHGKTYYKAWLRDEGRRKSADSLQTSTLESLKMR